MAPPKVNDAGRLRNDGWAGFVECIGRRRRPTGQAYRVALLAADTIEDLSEIQSTSGLYDLLGKFYLHPDQDTGLFVTEKLQTIPGVKDTYTLITFNAFGNGRG